MQFATSYSPLSHLVLVVYTFALYVISKEFLMTLSQDFMQDFMTKLGFPDAQVVVEDNPEAWNVQIDVDEQSSGILIGYHGETLQSFRMLLGLMVNNQTDPDLYKPVHLNVNDYGQQRESKLYELADSAVEKAVQSQQEILLPALPANERRIIHLYVEKEKPGVTTYSEGEGKARRLVIRPEIE